MAVPPSTDSRSGGLRATLRHGDFTKLWLGQIVSSSGDRFYQFALLHLFLGSTGGFMGSFGRDAARVVFCGMILPVVLAPWIGRQVDTHDRRKILLWAEAGRGLIALLLLLAWAAGLPLSFLLIFVAASGLLTGLFIPARQAALPMLVPRDHLVRGNALMTFAGIAAELAGATAGLAIALVGESFSFLAAALGYAFSTVMIFRIRTQLLPTPAGHPADEPEAPIAQPTLFTVRLLVWLTVAFTFVTGLFLPFFAQHAAVEIDSSWLKPWLSQRTDATFAGLVVLLGVTGIGLFAGMLTAGKIPRIAHQRALPVLMLAVWGAATWKLGATTAYASACVLCFFAGCATGLITIPADARLQHEVAGERHGRVFARRLALSNIAFLAGLALNLNGQLLRTFGSETMLKYLGLFSIVLALGFWLAAGKRLRGCWGSAAVEVPVPLSPR